MTLNLSLSDCGGWLRSRPHRQTFKSSTFVRAVDKSDSCRLTDSKVDMIVSNIPELAHLHLSKPVSQLKVVTALLICRLSQLVNSSSSQNCTSVTINGRLRRQPNRRWSCKSPCRVTSTDSFSHRYSSIFIIGRTFISLKGLAAICSRKPLTYLSISSDFLDSRR